VTYILHAVIHKQRNTSAVLYSNENKRSDRRKHYTRWL